MTKKDKQGISFYIVKAEHKDFILEKSVQSKNQYNAVIDFLDEVRELFDYCEIDDFKDDIHILFVTQEVQE
ncbi:hypothetical protein [Streptococcus uberis]|uniref:hypothetical protein n=1 Tax=Streptococcus uberis TaxID=1349 RepID=UPI001FF59966|nr:hypothetical protein [Streptococcus uberis]MCK1226013.1 hypothetical protein [Streptococcus uberis]